MEDSRSLACGAVARLESRLHAGVDADVGRFASEEEGAGHGSGELIDGHDQVIRINVPVISGFEDDVGRRTTVQMFWGDFGQSIPRFDEAQAGLPPAERAVAVQAPSTKRDIDNHFAALRTAAWPTSSSW